MSGHQTTYHVTSRDRAAQILAEGFTTDQLVYAHASLRGVRLMVHPNRNNVPSARFQVVGLSFDGVAVPEWLLQEMRPDEDPRSWESLPVNRIHDPIGLTVLEVTFGDDMSLDDYRYEEQVRLWNHESQEIRQTNHFEWSGEWLVPLEVAQRGRVRLLERTLEPEDYQALARWRTHWEGEGILPDEIQRRLDDLSEELRAWHPDDEEQQG